MEENKKICPGCPRGCDLSAPSCPRGEEYAKTGRLPQGHERGGHPGGHPGRLSFEKREQQLVMKYLHHAVGAADQGGISQAQASEMFSVLTEEETAQLAALLEKLSDHWMKLAPNMPSHHGKG
ncbi:MAG: hypothetical protein ACI4PC_08710 [Oscillospiraceae bacterium]